MRAPERDRPRPSRAPPAEGQVRLGRQRGDPDTRQVAPPLVDDEAPLPARQELPVELQQVVELEMPFEREEGSPLDLLQPVELGLRREQGGEGSEVERDAFEASLAGPFDRVADEPLVEAVRRVAKPNGFNE